MSGVRWLLVGAGDISRKRVAPALKNTEGSRIVSICDVNAANARSLGSEYGVERVFEDFDAALAGADIDAVYLATPVWLHAGQAVKALESGRHVLVEKPLGLSGEDGRRVLAAVRKSEKTAGCAYFRRFYPRYRYTQEMLSRGEFGRIVLVRMVYFSWFDPAPTDPKYWRVVREKSGGGPVSDMGSHMFDVLIGLFGMPESVYARCENVVHRWDVEDTASLIMKLPGGGQATASFAWNSKTWKHELEIVGTEAKLTWLPYDSGPVAKTVGRNTENIDLPCAENVHAPLVEDFMKAVAERRQPLCSVEEAVKTNLLIDAVYRSSRENRETTP